MDNSFWGQKLKVFEKNKIREWRDFPARSKIPAPILSRSRQYYLTSNKGNFSGFCVLKAKYPSGMFNREYVRFYFK